MGSTHAMQDIEAEVRTRNAPPRVSTTLDSESNSCSQHNTPTRHRERIRGTAAAMTNRHNWKEAKQEASSHATPKQPERQQEARGEAMPKCLNTQD